MSTWAGAWRKLQEWMQSTVVSPGLRFTASHAADTAALRGSRIIHQMKPGGIYITSGIIDDKDETVVKAVQASGLEVLEVTYQGEWVSVTARKPI